MIFRAFVLGSSPQGTEADANVEDTSVTSFEFNEKTVQTAPFLNAELQRSTRLGSCLCHRWGTSPEQEVALLTENQVEIVEHDEAVVVSTPVGKDDLVRHHATKEMRDKGVGSLTRHLAHTRNAR